MLYVSGEESERQIKLRGERLGISGAGLFLLGETSLERILEHVDTLKPAALVVDSVQTIYSAKFSSAPGSISQVREVATQLLFLAKGRGITTFLIGHVTKDGSLAGPKSLEHIVDTVLYFEGEKQQHHRIVRAVKNRFGAVSEMGVFEMTGTGLQAVPNPSALFLSERVEGSPGSAVVATLEGSRPMLVEVQALVSPTAFGTPRRMSIGLDANRTTLLLAVLEKRVGLELLGDDVFVSVAGGLEVAEPAVDLGGGRRRRVVLPQPPGPRAHGADRRGRPGGRGPRRRPGGPPDPRSRADGLRPLHPPRPQPAPRPRRHPAGRRPHPRRSPRAPGRRLGH